MELGRPTMDGGPANRLPSIVLPKPHTARCQWADGSCGRRPSIGVSVILVVVAVAAIESVGLAHGGNEG
jgi:hypothetical protein